jgi:hypothetical protein
MTNVAATAREWTLTGIAKGAGQCDCCSRRITQRVFEVSHPTLGVAALGRRCAAKATGYPATAIERELARIARMAELDRRRDIVATEFPELAAAYEACAAAYRQAVADGRNPEAARALTWSSEVEIFQTAYQVDCWWGGRGWAAYDTYGEYITECLTRA